MSRRSVLVIEDQADIRSLVRRLLEQAGYSVIEAEDGRAGLREFHERRPELVILDLGLPEVDGWATLERIRDMSDVPVLILTARSTEVEKVRGLQAGADDYMAKPFGHQELTARVGALFRRDRSAERGEQTQYADETLAIDFRKREVRVRDQEVPLTPLEFKLLATLVRHPNQVLSREQLLELVWDDPHAVSADQVKTYVAYLRRKLAPAWEGDPPIRTVRGFGYRYDPP